MVGLPSEFRANLDSYNGPLDLLLFLIKKDEIDVFDIPIAEVIVQYQVYLSLIKNLNPNLCGDFLVMAARLMEIKSKLLLPRQTLDEEEEGEDPRMELVRQLLEYKKFKERAILLEKRLDLHRRRYRRPSLHQPAWIVDEDIPLDLGKLSVWDLLTAFHKVEIALGQRGPHQVVLEDRPLEEYIRDVVEELEGRESQTALFEDLFRGARNRYEALSYFLAILQLAKDYRIYLDQDEATGEIWVRLRDEEETRRLLEAEDQPSGAEAAEEYLMKGEGQSALEVGLREEEAEPDEEPQR